MSDFNPFSAPAPHRAPGGMLITETAHANSEGEMVKDIVLECPANLSLDADRVPEVDPELEGITFDEIDPPVVAATPAEAAKIEEVLGAGELSLMPDTHPRYVREPVAQPVSVAPYKPPFAAAKKHWWK